MNKAELIQTLEKTLPELSGKLSIERVLFRAADNKAYFSLLSDVLVDERAFLKLDSRLSSLFPGMHIALRVASPQLKDQFLSDIQAYTPVLKAFLRRQSPAIRTWLDDVGWSIADEQILLVCPDDFAVQFFKRNKLDEKLSQAVWDIFRLRMPVTLEKCGEREQWVERMRAEAESRKAEQHLDDRAGNPHLQGSEPPAAPPPPPPEPKTPKAKPAKARAGAAIKGRAIAEKPVPIGELTEESGVVVVEGVVANTPVFKELKGGETALISFALGDETSTVFCKAFFNYKDRRSDEPPTRAQKEKINKQVEKITHGARLRLRGECKMDSFLDEISINIRDMQLLPTETRKDLAPEGQKRVELHLHTLMSAMDATADAADLVAQAAKWGHPAIAITDHGVTQAYPAAFSAAKKHGIKLIPGLEGYLCDSMPLVRNVDARPINDTIVVLDFETTGLSPVADRIIEIGAVKLANGVVTEEFSMLCDPGVPLLPKITEITGITSAMLQGKPSPAEGIRKLMDFIGPHAIAAHNASFDVGFLRAEARRNELSFFAPVIDTLSLARRMYPSLRSYRLGALCRMLKVPLKNAHRAVHDAAATAKVLSIMLADVEKRGAKTLQDIDGVISGESYSDSNHIILLCKTREGMENLSRIVTESHLKYFRRTPTIPRRLIDKYRAGLLVGSACEAGELFQAVAAGRSDETLEKIASFYDYLEIQPVGNNAFMLRSGEAESEDQLRDFNRKIVALGERLRKPVVATGDVHFKEPEDKIYRAILQAATGFEDADDQPPLYFKTTDEMLSEFSYLGEEKALEVVVHNPQKIADMVDALTLFPKHPTGAETFQPLWEDAAENIESTCWTRARELYGDPLPELIEQRLKKELHSIIGYGFATLYAIAQKLVQKSLADGYLVGSRGSVGSSFVAMLCGITEVNPLPPHYRCEKCGSVVFTAPELAAVGPDLPDSVCEHCGAPMIKDGYDIPFEVFLGFKGDKVPDIDLNFSGEYQPRAHAYVEELFGAGYVFRAGTISGLAEKTAFGFAAKYLQERGIRAGKAHKERLAEGLRGVKRTTGQHPGGIVVLPKEYNINQFTPIQHPADDTDANVLTTHYDFSSMHDILVKLDCLGHVDPTMLHYLEEITGVPCRALPLVDPGVMGLFLGTETIGVKPDELLSPTGTLGVPEFGTAFVQGMLSDTMPKTLEELIRISGLSHGTDVWLGNARDLVMSGTAKLAECFCTRDDIMNFLISKGMDFKLSFDIMEAVRKGRGLKPEMESAMKEASIPAWAIESCQKIKYMFPRSHAVAYVIMALRVAWYKVHRPLHYYAAYFSIRANGFDAAAMLTPIKAIRARIKELLAGDRMTPTEEREKNALHMILEMTLRGYKLLPVHLYKSDKRNFLIEGDGLRCPFLSINSFPEAAADGIIAERTQADFLSVEDLKLRAKIGDSAIDMLRKQGALEGLAQSNQLDLFSMMGNTQ
ncbi:MAG TPA: PolC-type DNA polymerase III [Candidatus Limiplasma sp.]|nr:PolC-type DNA polymerase III [Candidatus Limiplasma sp.]